MPNYDRRRTPTGRRASDRSYRHLIGDADVIDVIESLLSELEPEEKDELVDRLGGDRRRMGRAAIGLPTAASSRRATAA